MDYTKVRRGLIYKERTNFKEFGVQVPGSMNNLLFSNLKELFKATDRLKEIILRCFNNAYYICTIIPFDDFPETQVAEYEKLLLEDDPYDREEVCAVSMAMVCKLLPAIDAKWRPENSDLIEQIQYRFTHYQWMNSGARHSFEFMIEKHNTDELIISPSEFVPRDIIEVIEDCSDKDLQVYAEYICDRLALLKDQRQLKRAADVVIARIKDYQREFCEDYEYDPKKDCIKYADNDYSMRDLKWEDSVRSHYQQYKEALDYYTEHYPRGEENDSEENAVKSPQAPEAEVFQAKITELESKLALQEKQLIEANNINSQQATRIKELEAEVIPIKDLEADLEKLRTWKHLSRERVALFCHALAEYCKFVQKTKKNDIAPMAHELFGIGKKSAYNLMVSGYSKEDREHVAKIFEAIWPPFADFILNTFDKKEQPLKQ